MRRGQRSLVFIGLAVLAPATLAALALLSGCVGSLFKRSGPPPSVYFLTPPEAEPGAPLVLGPTHAETGATGALRSRTDLAILRPRVRTGLDTDLIALLYPDRHLDHLAAARWSGPLDEVIQDLVLEAFRARGVAANISGSAFGAAYWLEVDVDDFEAEYSASGAPPTVHVRFTARLGSAQDRQVLGRSVLEAHETAAADRVTAIVDAYNRAVDDVLRRLVDGTTAALASR